MSLYFIDISTHATVCETDRRALSAVFKYVHKTLRLHGETSVGVCFPQVKPHKQVVGRTLRLIGTQEALAPFARPEWEERLASIAAVASMRPVPPTSEHCLVRRVQPKTNADRLRRRHARRHNVSFEQACRIIPDKLAKHVPLPYLYMASAESQNLFPLWIDHHISQGQAQPGRFNSYGLSNAATVPWF